ncbi:MAG: L-ribulose-5-phosphate 4-epimerase [Bacteroidales bacterium]|nr:L-ribulose-5-phosphate 4-epimerase [Bacteroidales bacterium]
MLEELKQHVFQANMDLVKHNLVKFTWGNVSGIDRKKGFVVIKPSGLPYENMHAKDMVVVDFEGKVVDSKFKPSSDTATHLVLYKHFAEIKGVVHTHSPWAVTWAQAGLSIPALGTTHADHFNGSIPCTRKLIQSEIEQSYEHSTGEVIVETFKNIDHQAIPSVLVNCHGPFSWGNSPDDAVINSVLLEEVAKIAYHTMTLRKVKPIDTFLLDKHYNRKHGNKAYYGQK